MLRLPNIRNEFADIADRAMKEQMTCRGFLAELLMAECDDRARRRSERRIKAACFPREKSLRLRRNSNLDPATIHTLASCEWIKEGQPLCTIGDSGTGKSHMLIALGTEAAMKGYRVRHALAALALVTRRHTATQCKMPACGEVVAGCFTASESRPCSSGPR